MDREKWVDDMRAVACLLVATGHCLMGLYERGLIPNEMVRYEKWFVYLIYLFHVHLFFIASGYLYQKQNSGKRKFYLSNVKKKLIDLGIPYVVFCSCYVILKAINVIDANTQETGSWFTAVFRYSPNQMWYLFVLLAIFILIPFVIRNKRQSIAMLATGLGAYYIFYNILSDTSAVYAKILGYFIWFVLGMVLAHYGIEKVIKKISILFFFLFMIAASFLFYRMIPLNWMIRFTLSLCGVYGIIGLCYYFFSRFKCKFLSLISKYLMQIYLLHTFFAAFWRNMLLKVGIYNVWFHFFSAMIICIGGSIILSMICNRLVWPNMVFNPRKTYRQLSSKKQK